MSKRSSRILNGVVCAALILLVAFIEGCWFFLKKEFDGVSLDSIIFTARTASFGNAEPALVNHFLRELSYSYGIAAVLLIFLFRPFSARVKSSGKQLFPLSDKARLFAALILLLAAAVHVSVNLELPRYIAAKSSKTAIYEEYYVPPEKAEIVFPGRKRNLILVYLESMENTFMSEEYGGGRI